MSLEPDITVTMLATRRLTVCVRELAGREAGWPVVFVHGNVSSSVFFFPAMRALPDQYRPIAVDLRGFGGTDTKPIDARRGLADFAEDLLVTLDALGLDDAHLVGWSMGAGVVLQAIIEQPARARSITLINPVSPYGFGGTTGVDGRLVSPDGAGSGGGTANPAFVEALAGRDGPGDEDGPSSARAVLRNFYVAPGWAGEDEDVYVGSMMSTAIGEDNYPGDSRSSSAWPGIAPGTRGVLNTMAPVHLDLSAIADVQPQPPILWLRGELDQIVSDTSMFDFAQLGALGVVPGYPGVQAMPPQPMLAQTRSVLDAYATAGGVVEEVVLPGVGHSPHIEATDAFVEHLARHLAR